MTSLRDSEGRFDRLKIAHFADQDYIRILTKRSAQSVSETAGIGVDLTLIHNATLVVVKKLNRVLDRENVLAALSVDFVNHRRERCRFAGTRGPGHQHQTARLV